MLENGKLCWLWTIDIFIALLCKFHFLSFYAIFALKFRPILIKDFHYLNTDNLRKQNLSNGRFFVTVCYLLFHNIYGSKGHKPTYLLLKILRVTATIYK